MQPRPDLKQTRIMKTNSHVSRAFLLAAFFAVCGLPCPLLGVQIGWDDGMLIWLGDGVHLHDQGTRASLGIVELAPIALSAKNGWQNEIVSFAQNTHDMVKTLNINSSLKVQSTFGSGG